MIAPSAARVVVSLAAVLATASCGEGGSADGASTASSSAAPPTTTAGPTTVPGGDAARSTTQPTTTSTSVAPTTLPATTVAPTSSIAATSSAPSTVPTTTAAPAPPRTACAAVTVIGDSTLIGADGSTGLIGEADSITTRLAEIGVVDLRLEVGGGRSVVERLGQQENGEEVAARTRATGFAGCWVVALGTNDAANIAAGSQADAEDRVGRILDATEAGPILWLDASTITDETFWARANTQSWNSALEVAVGALDDGGRIDVAEWDAVAASQPWFVADGIHHNAAGLAARVAFIADELLATYPER